MPGHIWTGIVLNSGLLAGGVAEARRLKEDQRKKALRVAEMKAAKDPDYERLERRGILKFYDRTLDKIPDEELAKRMGTGAGLFKEAGTSAEDAAEIILTGVKNGDWRILVGEDAVALDKVVRSRPFDAYDAAFA